MQRSALVSLLHQLDTGVFVRPAKQTVKDYLEAWLRDTAYPNLSPRTFEAYEYIVQKYINPALGQTPLTQLKPQQLQKLYADTGKNGLSTRTARYIHQTMHKSLKDAVKLGLLVRNPADAVQTPKVQRREMQTMNESDIHLLLEYARSTPHYALFYTLLFTGMRRSEALALRWSDIDLILGTISVSRTIHHLRYGTYKGQTIYKQPKSDKGRRQISLSPSTAIALREHREAQDKVRQALGLASLSDSDLVFSTYDGKPMLPDSISHTWHTLVKRTGLTGLRLHDCRHTHASLMLKQGVHPKIVQERLGHSTIAVTLDLYSHVAPGLQQAAANAFDDIVMPKVTEIKR